ncbi:MAG: hypothetical protein ACXU98_12040 [Syntrophales bacterium]
MITDGKKVILLITNGSSIPLTTIDTLNFDKMTDLLKRLVTVAKNLAMTSSSR